MIREEAKNFLTDISYKLDNMAVEYLTEKDGEKMREAVKTLEQEPKTGHWIIIDDCEQFIAKCSECGRIEDSRMISKYPYCHCGAMMVEPQENEDE